MRAVLFWVFCCVLLFASMLQAEDTTPQLIRSIDAAVERGTQFLIDQQDHDGAWRAKSYPAFKQGDALTPLVLSTLLPLPLDTRSAKACEHGLDYLAVLGKQTFARPDGVRELAFPSYTAALTTLALHQWRRAADDELRAAWTKYLSELQLTEATGWQPSDPQYGGWGYGHAAAKKPADGSALGPIDEPNMSATVYAVIALQTTGISPFDKSSTAARHFVMGLQNAPLETEQSQPWHDNGFFFVHGDAVRNKAGALRHGERLAFRSYGSTTADGALALYLCRNLTAKVEPSEQRLPAAVKWLNQHFSADHVPGDYAPDRAAARDGVYFYYTASLAHLYRLTAESYTRDSTQNVAKLVEAIRARQQADGSWKNSVPEQREDEPLVATSLAIKALSACRELLADSGPQPVYPLLSGELVAHARDAICHGTKFQYEPQPQKNTLGYWTDEADSAWWKLQVSRPGRYRVLVWQGCGTGQGGSEIEVGVGDQSLKIIIEETGHFQNFLPRQVGEITFDQPGEYSLNLQANSKAKAAVGDVRQIQLIPLP